MKDEGKQGKGLARPRALAPNPARPSPIVLVLEDSEDDFYLLERAFKKLDAKADILHVCEGSETIRYLTEAKGAIENLPALLLLDLKLPGISGLEVLKWVRNDSVFKVLPVNILSSSAEPCDIQKAFELGANAFTVKPVGLEAFEQLVATLCKFWLELSQLPRLSER